MLELQAYFAPAAPGQRVQAVPAAGTEVPLWILGSSTVSARSSPPMLGLPFAFASHFAPDALMAALEIYRSRFKPSRAAARPYAMVGVNVIAADSDAEARRLATTQQMSFANILRGERGLSRPPIDDIESYWTPAEKAQALQMLARSIVGSPATVRAGLEALVAETGADELMIVSDVFDHAARLRSFELIAAAYAPAAIRRRVKTWLEPRLQAVGSAGQIVRLPPFAAPTPATAPAPRPRGSSVVWLSSAIDAALG